MACHQLSVTRMNTHVESVYGFQVQHPSPGSIFVWKDFSGNRKGRYFFQVSKIRHFHNFIDINGRRASPWQFHLSPLCSWYLFPLDCVHFWLTFLFAHFLTTLPILMIIYINLYLFKLLCGFCLQTGL